jgi:hypothetical protein
MLAASSDMRPSLMWKTDCLWAMTLVKYPSWVRVPSGRSPVYKRTEESCQSQDVTRYKDGYTHVFVHLICTLTPVVVHTQPTLVVARDLCPRPRNHLPAPPSRPSAPRKLCSWSDGRRESRVGWCIRTSGPQMPDWVASRTSTPA